MWSGWLDGLCVCVRACVVTCPKAELEHQCETERWGMGRSFKKNKKKLDQTVCHIQNCKLSQVATTKGILLVRGTASLSLVLTKTCPLKKSPQRHSLVFYYENTRAVCSSCFLLSLQHKGKLIGCGITRPTGNIFCWTCQLINAGLETSAFQLPCKVIGSVPSCAACCHINISFQREEPFCTFSKSL